MAESRKIMKCSDKKVIVLLSTYNAQKYLEEQLDSLRLQTHKNIEIIIRDDGSKDETVVLIQKYQNQYPNMNLQYYAGENLGAIGSFFDLMKYIKEKEFSFCAFCDQDDYWLPEKIERALEVIDKVSCQDNGTNPNLYCSAVELVDEQLQHIPTNIKKEIRPAFSNALVENVVTGCTVVMDKKMYEVMLNYMPSYCIMHDWWMYLVGTCFGRVIYDENAYIKYRQHGNNVMGMEQEYSKEMKSRMQKFKSRQNNISLQAKELLRLIETKEDSLCYKQKTILVSEKDKINKLSKDTVWYSQEMLLNECYARAQLLMDYRKSLKKRIKLAFYNYVYRMRKEDQRVYRILFLLGLR